MYSAIIVAAGSGKRTGLEYNKIFYLLRHKPIIEYSVNCFLQDSNCGQIIVVCQNEDLERLKQLFRDLDITYVIGGLTRQESVYNGLLEAKHDYVFIHDGARPNINLAFLELIYHEVILRKAVAPALPLIDTVKIVEEGIIKKSLSRDSIYRMQTPQAFDTKLITQAHKQALDHQRGYTDDTSVFQEELNQPVFVVPGLEQNIKGTTLTDMKLLEELL